MGDDQDRLAAARRVIVDAIRRRPFGPAGLTATFDAIMDASAAALGVRRASLWRIDAAGRLACRTMRIDGAPSRPPPDIEGADTYVRALQGLDVVAVDDIHDDPRTREFVGYADAHQIGALIDVPVIQDGRLHTVICHEHVGGPRRWTDDERGFAVTVGAMISLALETEERVREEHVRQGVEARYRHLVESLPCVVYAFDFATGRLTYLSPNATMLGGWTAEQWLRDEAAGEWIRRIDPAGRAAVEARFDPSIATSPPPELTYRIALPDGSRRWIRDACAVVRGPLGDPIAIQGTLSDVTTTVEAEAAVHEQQRRFEALFDTIDLLGVIVDREGRIVRANAACAAALARPVEQLVGAIWREVALPAEDRAEAPLLPAPGRALGRIQSARGDIRLVDWTHTTLRDHDEAPLRIASLGIDTTARAEVEAAVLRDARFETLGRVSALVAHDLNNLLTVLELTLGQLEQRDRALEPLLEPLRQVAARARGMTRMIRSAQAGGGGTLEIATGDLLANADAIWRMMARNRAVLDVRVVDPAVVAVEADAVTALLTNLVGNALDATPADGRVEVETRCVDLDASRIFGLGGKRPGRYAVFTVRDNGAGMTSDVAARVFEPFFTTKAAGSGLGLAGARGIAERHGGFVTVESAQGRGTTFEIYLPVARGER